MTKRCSRCKSEKPRSEFTRDKQTPDGLNRRCKECRRKLSAAYAVAHPEKGAERTRRWRAQHGETVNAKAREWRAQNPKRVAEIKRVWRERNPDSDRAYYLANREAINARSKARRADEPDPHRERVRRWMLANPTKVREIQTRRRARLRSATVGDVDLEALWVANQGRCQLCGHPIDRTLRFPDPMSASVDHIVPLARGGTHEQSNLQWTHLVENIQKGASVPD